MIINNHLVQIILHATGKAVYVYMKPTDGSLFQLFAGFFLSTLLTYLRQFRKSFVILCHLRKGWLICHVILHIVITFSSDYHWVAMHLYTQYCEHNNISLHMWSHRALSPLSSHRFHAKGIKRYLGLLPLLEKPNQPINKIKESTIWMINTITDWLFNCKVVILFACFT